MKRTPLIVSLLWLAGIAQAVESANPAQSPTLNIGSEARCVANQGIPIKETPDNQVRLACLKDRAVQEQCNPDGGHARLEAFRKWVTQVEDFKERCSSVGGVFAYADPNFTEPANAYYCSIAQPEVSYSSFETPLCNFVSSCPEVAVTCLRPEETLIQAAPRTVSLPGVPNPISVSR